MPPRPPYRVTAAGKAKVYVSSAAVVLFVIALYFFSFSDVGSQKTLTQVSTSERRSQSRANMFRQRTVEGDEEPENSASDRGDDEEGEEEVEVKSKHSSNKSRDEDEAVEDTETKSSKRKGRNKLEEEEVEETRPKSRAKPRKEEEEEVEEEKPSKKKKTREEEEEEEEEKPSKKKRAKEVEEEEEEIPVKKYKKKARKEDDDEEQQEEAPKLKKKSIKISTLGEYPEFTNTCTKKPLPYTRDELRKIALEEFLPLLQEHREIFGMNKQGQAISHQLATYVWAKKLKEMGIDTFIESGILKGSCTRLIHLAHPKARIISMDPYDKRRFKIPHLRPEDDFVGKGKFQDFGLVDWTKHPDVNPKKTAIFLDDHQSHAKRLAHCIKMGFTHVFFDDNMNFDSFSSKAMCTDDHGEPGDVPPGVKIMKFNKQIDIEEKLRKPFLIYLDNFNFDMMGINATYFHYLQDWFHDNMVQYFEFPPFADDSRTPWQYTHTREVGQDPLFDCTDEDDPDKGDCELIKPFMLDQRYGADRESYLFYYGYAAWVTLKKNPDLPHLPDIQRDYGSRGNAYFDIQ